MIKKTLIIFIFIILFSNVLAETNISQNVTQNAISNPITNFMQKQTSSEFFKFIGAPTQLTNQDLILYLLFILVVYIIIADILNGVGLFDKKWIQNSISLIVVLIGIYSGGTYKMITSFTKIGFTSLYATTITYYIIAGIICGFLIIRLFIKIIKRNGRTSEEKAEERADKIRLLRKAQDIEARAAGIE